ncbi:MAG: DUF1553 domain-containing protein [Acidobacteria bacterium]|nr:DUF1553 domain-containing protein [Acidobacteriota bacterium]
MNQPQRFALVLAAGTLVVFLGAQDQDPVDLENHSECNFFSGDREKYSREARDRYWRGNLTEEVTKLRLVPAGTRTKQLQDQVSDSPIDIAVFGELQKRGIAPAEKTNDFEFARRVTLDLTGRVPSYDALIQFTSGQSPNKRAELVDRLLNSPEYVDKWTMYFGDLYRNTQNSDVTPRFNAGRNAFYRWIKASLEANKPYNVMATELIASKSRNSFEDGTANFLIGSDTNGGPNQDDYDQMAADVNAAFLGMGHVNCVLCHNGRGHLEELSLWGRNAKRSDAWGTASFFSRTSFAAIRPDPQTNPNLRYYALNDVGRTDYGLNTTTGNRPARQPIDGLGATAPPRYMFTGQRPNNGENYRDALARFVTNDFQFARATVNYMWAALMGRGLVEPLDQFDPARLDPDNPPSGTWALQPSHPALLNTLADQFRANNYDLKWLMRTIVNSETYQLSSRYAGEWNPTYESTFARKLVRRLMAEEIHDAMSTTSNILPTYNILEPSGPLYTNRDTRPVRFAMQLPETGNQPDGNGAARDFLNSFTRGNRLDDDRKSDGSAIQALSLMNDAFVMTRIRSSNTGGQQSLLNRFINMADTQLVNQLYLTVLSRYPSQAEADIAIATLRGTSGTTRTQRGENLLWSLYNKVDFIYNY